MYSRQFAVVWMRRTQAVSKCQDDRPWEKLLDNLLPSPKSYVSVLALAGMQLR